MFYFDDYCGLRNFQDKYSSILFVTVIRKSFSIEHCGLKYVSRSVSTYKNEKLNLTINNNTVEYIMSKLLLKSLLLHFLEQKKELHLMKLNIK